MINKNGVIGAVVRSDCFGLHANAIVLYWLVVLFCFSPIHVVIIR